MTPEIDICKSCRCDITDRSEDVLVCPECGGVNDRIVARARREAKERAIGEPTWGDWGLWFPACLTAAASVLAVGAASTVASFSFIPVFFSHPFETPVSVGCTYLIQAVIIYSVATMRTPASMRIGKLPHRLLAAGVLAVVTGLVTMLLWAFVGYVILLAFFHSGGAPR